MRTIGLNPNRPTRWWRFFIAVSVVLLINVPLLAKQLPKVVVTLDRADARYDVGESVTFTIKVEHADGSPVSEPMAVQLNLPPDDGRQPVMRNSYPIDSTPAVITKKLEQPGFLRLTAIGREWQGERCYIKTFGVAACEPEKIEPVVTMPEDFDAFWANGRKRLAAIPVDYQQERIDHLCTDEYDVFKVSFANVDNTRSYGYLLVPTSGKQTYPGLIAVASAGKGKPREDFVAGRLNNIARNEAICLFMGVYAHDLGLSKEYYQTYQRKGSGWNTPEDHFYARSILGIDRAITWLASRQDIDTNRIVYTGSSQGGGYGLVLAGLNKHITAANVNISALCDHLAYQENRYPGWPGVLGSRQRRKLSDEQINTIAKALPYFDAVNFARRINVPVLMTMGYQDTTCPPGGIYAAYNVITAPKQMVSDPNVGHGHSKQMTEARHTWLREKLGLAEIQDSQN